MSKEWYMSIKKIKGRKLDEITSIFPFIKFDDLCPEDGSLPDQHIMDMYSFNKFSVFDHILTDEEFREEKALDFCSGVINAQDEETTLLYAKRELRFVTFYLRLRKFVGADNVYFYIENRGFYKFYAFKPYYTKVIDHIRETTYSLERFCFPTLGMFITPGWYFDHHITANKDLYQRDVVERIVQDCGLHILA